MQSAKACAALYRADLPQLLHVHHAQQLPMSALQFSGCPDSQKLSAEDLSGLDSGSLIVMSALKCLKLDLCSIACLTTDAQAAVAQWNHIVHPQRTNQTASKPDKYMVSLRATVLVFKLATLASGMKGATSVSKAMWHTLSLLSERLESSHAGSSLPNPSTINSPPGLQVESGEQLYLSWQLMERILPVISQQEQSGTTQAAVCCGLLLRLLKTAAPSVQLGMVLAIIDSGEPSRPACHKQLRSSCAISLWNCVRRLYCSSPSSAGCHWASAFPMPCIAVHSLSRGAVGGIAALGMALSQTRKLAISAVRLMKSQLPAQMVADSEAQLAGTKAVLASSALLCPPVTHKQRPVHRQYFIEWGKSAQQSAFKSHCPLALLCGLTSCVLSCRIGATRKACETARCSSTCHTVACSSKCCNMQSECIECFLLAAACLFGADIVKAAAKADPAAELPGILSFMHRLLDRQTGCQLIHPAEPAYRKLPARSPATPVSKSSADKGKISRATQTEIPSHVPWQDRAEGRIAWQGFVPHDQLFNPVDHGALPQQLHGVTSKQWQAERSSCWSGSL